MPSGSTILLIESDREASENMAGLLSEEGHQVEIATAGLSGFAKAFERRSSLVILNAALPDKTGFQVCCELRQAGVDTAILMLTGRALVMDRVAALKLGADDCLAIPFDPSELLARVEALLRRVEKQNRIPLRTYQYDDVELDFERSEIRRGGQPLMLAAKERQLMFYLVQNRDRVVPREEILRKVWQYNGEVSSRTLDVHISWLRQKLDPPRGPQHIQTIRGKGYRFTA